ncbi:MAG: MATE family efflux transporter [Clostridia bacterium]|nr:MATE family efflux transporter [Clostridia bacterium]
MIKLSDHFSYKRILRFTLPSVVMMVFTSIYGVVDGFFISNFVGKTEFSAVNFVMPLLMMLAGVGFMFGAGGSALISKTLGEGDGIKANKQFSLFIITTAVLGSIIAIIGMIVIRPISALLGAEGAMLDACELYGRIILCALPFFMLQLEFQSFFVTAERPKLGLICTIIAGVTNMVLDALLVAVIPLGLVGAALATALSQVVGGLVPLIYFLLPNKSLLRIGKPIFDAKALIKASTNGSSELLNNIAMSLVGMLYNVQLLKYAGENGVAAYGVIMYVSFVFSSMFIGFSIGTAPIVGYHFGAKNSLELKSILKKSAIIVAVGSITMTLLAEILATPLSKLFVSYDQELLELTKRAFFIYSFSYLAMGFAMFASGFFTALNDGLTSAILSFMRTLVFQISMVFLLPLAMGIDGIWLSVVIAETLALVLSVIFLFVKRKKFNYM